MEVVGGDEPGGSRIDIRAAAVAGLPAADGAVRVQGVEVRGVGALLLGPHRHRAVVPPRLLR